MKLRMSKKMMAVFFLLLPYVYCAGQDSKQLVRRDTTLLKADECQWLLKKDGVGTPVPTALLNAIASGRLKAVDPQTRQPIPPSKIFTWRQPVDTVMTYNAKSEKDEIKVIQHEVKPENFTRLRVYHDWILDVATGKLQAILKSVEMLADIHGPDGSFRGYAVFCVLE